VFVQRAGRGASDPHARVQHERTPARSRCGQCSEVAHQAQSVIEKRLAITREYNDIVETKCNNNILYYANRKYYNLL